MTRLQLGFTILSTFAALRSVIAKDGQQKPIITDDYVCQHPPYQVMMVSKSPLVIYINNFLTAEERGHLQLITKDTFTRSDITSPSRKSKSVRTSQSTSLTPDPITRCIESRALAFQGYDIPPSHLEPLQLVKYNPTEHYHYHTDWFTPSSSGSHATPRQGGNRVSSFFAYVHVANDTTGGGTNFPRLDPPKDERWCEEGIVDCDEAWDEGLTFLPVEGNAIYWENLDGQGRGDERTLHAGLPVVSGGKIGMNIWTREGPVGGGLNLRKKHVLKALFQHDLVEIL